MPRNGKEGEKISARGEKWTRRFFNLRNMAWSSVHGVTARDMFKLQIDRFAQSAEALGTLKETKKDLNIPTNDDYC